MSIYRNDGPIKEVLDDITIKWLKGDTYESLLFPGLKFRCFVNNNLELVLRCDTYDAAGAPLVHQEVFSPQAHAELKRNHKLSFVVAKFCHHCSKFSSRFSPNYA